MPKLLKGWSAANKKAGTSIADLAKDPALIAVIQTAIDDANKAVSRAESDPESSLSCQWISPSLMVNLPQRCQ
jgi:hypothetical protein